ncbi:hypothetical protein F5Y19DRAFT_312207 [Xylariaceae sp. FL1651]|nr:hypothetical protein F5Y19DRAFT_312207 [Xylariaceae sp. FL1651]
MADLPAFMRHPRELSAGGANPNAVLYVVVASIITALMLFFVLTRLYIRFLIQKTPSWDDVACIIATLTQLSYTGLLLYITTLGLGRHVRELSAEAIEEIVRLSQVDAYLSSPCLLFTKLSLFFLYHRLFAPNKTVRYGIYVGVVLCTIFYTTALFLFIFLIKDYEKAVQVNFAFAIVNPIFDFYALSLPLVAVVGLHLSMRKKLGILAIFLWGLLACVLSILGAVYRIDYTLHGLSDVTYGLLTVFTVNTVEVSIGITCGCLPVMPVILQRMRVKGWVGKPSRTTPTDDVSVGNRIRRTLEFKVSTQPQDQYMELKEMFRDRVAPFGQSESSMRYGQAL